MNLKRIFLCFLLGLGCLLANAQGMVVHQKDGTQMKIPFEQLDCITFYDTDGHEWVDLGLPSGTLWATCNVGTERPEDYGDYFAWGETHTKEVYNWDSYLYCNISLTKYCLYSDYGTVDEKKELEAVDDAATVNWGEDWQMPNIEQFIELIHSGYTSTEWTTVNGVKGRKITSKSNSRSIFLPAAGWRDGTSLSGTGLDGNYWARSLYSGSSDSGCKLYFYSNYIYKTSIYRYFGHSVRPVRVQR